MSILDSTVWQEDLATKVVWITILAMKDRDGYVGASVPGLAKRAGVTIAECEKALEKFKSPDPYSRTKDHEGRRIEDAEGGWVVLNHSLYREKMSQEDRREYQRKKQAEYRARKRGLPLPGEVQAVKAMERGDEETADRLSSETRQEVEIPAVIPKKGATLTRGSIVSEVPPATGY